MVFASNAGLLITAECRMRRVDVIAVGPYASSLNTTSEATVTSSLVAFVIADFRPDATGAGLPTTNMIADRSMSSAFVTASLLNGNPKIDNVDSAPPRSPLKDSGFLD